MPVTKTAKRALRSSRKKESVNKTLVSRLEVSLRKAKKDNKPKSISEAFSLVDRVAKKKLIHKNKAARIKSSLSKLLVKKSRKTNTSSKKKAKRTSPIK